MTDKIQQFDCSVNLLQSLLWQHDNAEKLKALVSAKQAWYSENQCGFWHSWYRDVFNIDTANEFGLSVWSRILGLPLKVQVEASAQKDAFGFGAEHNNFENGNFARSDAGDIPLSTDQARLALRMRYFQLVSRGSVSEINEWLSALFGDRGRVFVSDQGDMTYATYFFGFTPDAQLRFILEKYDLLPRPAGVGVRYLVQVKKSFGFGPDNLNFNNGSFGAYN